MTYSKAQIFNITLNILGVSMPLENANSNDNRAILLNNYYFLARDYVLKDFDWNFASTFKELSLVQNFDLIFGYKYCYDYPNDCICARDVFEKGDYRIQKYTVASLENGDRAIFTNVEHAVLRYTRRIDKEVYFGCEFSMALAHYLAALTSNVLTGSTQKGEAAYQKYRAILKRAKVLNAEEGINDVYDENTYIDARS